MTTKTRQTQAIVPTGGTPAPLTIVRPQAIEPSSMAELRLMAKDALDSGFFGIKNPAQAMMLLLRGKDLGFSYAQACSAFHLIKDKPTLTSDAMVAVCLQRRDLCEYFKPISQDEKQATWETKRVGHDEPIRLTFTIEEARAAGLFQQNGAMWSKYPKRMLSARCKAFLARDVFPELLLGLLSAEEAHDIPDDRHEAPVVRVPDNRKKFDRERDEPEVVEIEAEQSLASVFLDYVDACLDQAAYDTLAAEIKQAIREHKLTPEEIDVVSRAMAGLAESRGFVKTAARKAKSQPAEAVPSTPATPGPGDNPDASPAPPGVAEVVPT